MSEKDEKQNENENEKKEIEVINGDGKDLNISRVYEHIKSDKLPNSDKKGNIVIPKSNSKKD